jgi:hypothetical protein
MRSDVPSPAGLPDNGFAMKDSPPLYIISCAVCGDLCDIIEVLRPDLLSRLTKGELSLDEVRNEVANTFGKRVFEALADVTQIPPDQSAKT